LVHIMPCLVADHCFILHFLYISAAPTEIYTLSLHDALPILSDDGSPAGHGFDHDQSKGFGPIDGKNQGRGIAQKSRFFFFADLRSEEHTSELQSLRHLVCRLLLEKKKVDLSFHSISHPYFLA